MHTYVRRFGPALHAITEELQTSSVASLMKDISVAPYPQLMKRLKNNRTFQMNSREGVPPSYTELELHHIAYTWRIICNLCQDAVHYQPEPRLPVGPADLLLWYKPDEIWVLELKSLWFNHSEMDDVKIQTWAEQIQRYRNFMAERFINCRVRGFIVVFDSNMHTPHNPVWLETTETGFITHEG
jgi:hypothetical protein